MRLRSDLSVLADTLTAAKLRVFERDSVNESFESLQEDIGEVQELVDTLLAYHREYHTEPSPKFCTPPCQLADLL